MKNFFSMLLAVIFASSATHASSILDAQWISDNCHQSYNQTYCLGVEMGLFSMFETNALQYDYTVKNVIKSKSTITEYDWINEKKLLRLNNRQFLKMHLDYLDNHPEMLSNNVGVTFMLALHEKYKWDEFVSMKKKLMKQHQAQLDKK